MTEVVRNKKAMYRVFESTGISLKIDVLKTTMLANKSLKNNRFTKC